MVFPPMIALFPGNMTSDESLLFGLEVKCHVNHQSAKDGPHSFQAVCPRLSAGSGPSQVHRWLPADDGSGPGYSTTLPLSTTAAGPYSDYHLPIYIDEDSCSTTVTQGACSHESI